MAILEWKFTIAFGTLLPLISKLYNYFCDFDLWILHEENRKMNLTITLFTMFFQCAQITLSSI